ncbi:hypothetical protein K3495_g8695 [Podosphaera aphanis]|nr:hypothetical protein K3495_g8695 [Podosphaera aphanis]
MKRSDDLAELNRICGRDEEIKRQKLAVKIAAFQEWKHSWICQENSGHPTPANPETCKAANISIDQKQADSEGTIEELQSKFTKILAGRKPVSPHK